MQPLWLLWLQLERHWQRGHRLVMMCWMRVPRGVLQSRPRCQRTALVCLMAAEHGEGLVAAEVVA